MNDTTRTCATCAHRRPVPLRSDVVECRGAPPQIVALSGGLVSMFPQIMASASCDCWQFGGIATDEAAAKTAGKTAGGTDGKA